MKNKLTIIIGVVLALAVITLVILLGSGRLFQRALYNIRPIYSDCRIEGQGVTLTEINLCEHFTDKLKDGTLGLANGEYTAFTKYTDTKLPNGLIPFTINNKQATCNFVKNGFTPQIDVIDPSYLLSSERITLPRQIPVGSNGAILVINYTKNGQVYPYDDNICETSFEGALKDEQQVTQSVVKLDVNGFLNSRPLVNEILLTNTPYSNTQKIFEPGNLFLNLNIIPDLTFKLTIPCSNSFPQVEISETKTNNKDTEIKVKGLSDKFLSSCQDKLYLSFQNANKYDDSQLIHDLKFNKQGNQVSIPVKLYDLARIQDKNATFPFIYTVKLHLKDRSDSQEVKTLGTGVFTVVNYIQKTSSEETSESASTASSGDENISSSNDKTSSDLTNKTTVRRVNSNEVTTINNASTKIDETITPSQNLVNTNANTTEINNVTNLQTIENLNKTTEYIPAEPMDMENSTTARPTETYTGDPTTNTNVSRIRRMPEAILVNSQIPSSSSTSIDTP